MNPFQDEVRNANDRTTVVVRHHSGRTDAGPPCQGNHRCLLGKLREPGASPTGYPYDQMISEKVDVVGGTRSRRWGDVFGRNVVSIRDRNQRLTP